MEPITYILKVETGSNMVNLMVGSRGKCHILSEGENRQ
jgi:hypothetical protein